MVNCVNTLNSLAAAYAGYGQYVGIATGLPGSSDVPTNECSGGSPAYSRVPSTWSAGSTGIPARISGHPEHTDWHVQLHDSLLGGVRHHDDRLVCADIDSDGHPRPDRHAAAVSADMTQAQIQPSPGNHGELSVIVWPTHVGLAETSDGPGDETTKLLREPHRARRFRTE